MKDLIQFLNEKLETLDLLNHDDLIRRRLILEILDFIKNGKR